jgi:hypothetical protein
VISDRFQWLGCQIGCQLPLPQVAADVARNLEFDVARYLRLLCRRGFLVSERQAEEDESITFAVHFPGRVCISSSGPDRGFASGIASTAQAVFWPI